MGKPFFGASGKKRAQAGEIPTHSSKGKKAMDQNGRMPKKLPLPKGPPNRFEIWVWVNKKKCFRSEQPPPLKVRRNPEAVGVA